MREGIRTLAVALGLQLLLPGLALAQGLPANLIHRWEAEGNADDSEGINDGTLQSGAGFGAGKIGQAFSFDGVDDNVLIAQDTFDGLASVTVTAWVRTTAGAATDQTIISALENGVKSSLTLFINNGKLRFWLGSNNCIIEDTVVFDVNAFHHVAAVKDGADVRLYFDGVEEVSGNCALATVESNGGTTRIGAHDGKPTTRHWQGFIDDVRVYDRALSGAEIATDMDFSPNAAPVANNDEFSTPEDTQLSVNGVLDNDTDDDGDALTAALVQDVGDGILNLDPDGSFTYLPDADFTGQDAFMYRASDGTANSNVATVIIAVTGENDAPVAGDDAYSVPVGDWLTIPSPGVLGNDTDVEGDALTASIFRGPLHGQLLFSPDGSFQYRHGEGFEGTDSFVYRATDGTGADMATVTIVVGCSGSAAGAGATKEGGCDGDGGEDDDPPGVATLVAPTGPIGTGNPVFEWERDPAAGAFLLHVRDAANALVLSRWFEAHQVCSGTACSVTDVSSLADGAYKWGVLSANGAGHSEWPRLPMSFTIEGGGGGGVGVLAEAVLIAPMGSIDTGNPTFEWLGDASASSFLLHVRDADGVLVIARWFQRSDVCSGSDCAATVSTSLLPGDYVFAILSQNGAGSSEWPDPPTAFTVQ